VDPHSPRTSRPGPIQLITVIFSRCPGCRRNAVSSVELTILTECCINPRRNPFLSMSQIFSGLILILELCDDCLRYPKIFTDDSWIIVQRTAIIRRLTTYISPIVLDAMIETAYTRPCRQAQGTNRLNCQNHHDIQPQWWVRRKKSLAHSRFRHCRSSTIAHALPYSVVCQTMLDIHSGAL
jgi:hypothetical protein